MIGTCVTNLVAEIRASGDHLLAAKLVHAIEHDAHIADHCGTYFEDCIYCRGELADNEVDQEHDGSLSGVT